MKIRDKLREAREKSLERARAGWQETRESLQDVQRRIRQRMRIFPQRKDTAVPPVLVNTAQDHGQNEKANAPYRGIQLRQPKPFFSAPKKGPEGGKAA